MPCALSEYGRRDNQSTINLYGPRRDDSSQFAGGAGQDSESSWKRDAPLGGRVKNMASAGYPRGIRGRTALLW